MIIRIVLDHENPASVSFTPKPSLLNKLQKVERSKEEVLPLELLKEHLFLWFLKESDKWNHIWIVQTVEDMGVVIAMYLLPYD